jgi:hypothetical protein
MDDFLGAGHTGKGWTIDEAVMEGGKPVIKLHRRIKETGQIEEHTIDIDTFKAAKAYKDVQGGMSKAGRAPLLKRSDLGRSLDPQGEIIPDRFDGASRSYRVLLPGSRQPQWVPEGLIRDFKEGKPGALQRLRATVGLDKPQDETPAQAITSAVAGAVLGKNLATRLGLRAQRQEQSVDRPSAPTTASTQTRQANRAAVLPEDRAAQEDQARQKTLRQRREEIEDEEDAHDPAPSRRTIRYQATNAEGASAQVTSQDSQDQASTRLETTGRPRLDSVSTEKKGTRLSVDETTIPSPSAETSDVSAAINRPKQAPSAQVSQTVGEESSSPSSPSVLRDEETKDDPVQATLERAARRKQRQRTSANSPTSSAGYSGVTYGASAPQPSPNDLGALAASVDASPPAKK